MASEWLELNLNKVGLGPVGNYSVLNWSLFLVFWIIDVCFTLSIILQENQSDYWVLLGKTVLYQQSIWGGGEE